MARRRWISVDPADRLLHMPSRARDPRVLILLNAGAAWSRGVLRGFTAAVRQKGWTLVHYQTPMDLSWLVETWKPNVVVLQWSLYRHVAQAFDSCTAISVNDDSSAHGVASVCVDESGVAQLAAKHLMSKGLRELTTFRFNDGTFAVSRERAFGEAVRAHGARLVPGWWLDGVEPPRFHENPEAITTWLAQLPRPCGVFACTDSWASVVARYAQLAGVRIPEDLALIGVDNDTLECELASPPLSSVCVPWRTVGEKAAWLVGRALAGAPVAHERIVVPPVDVIARRSTDVAVVGDPTVERAMSHITEHIGRRLTLNGIARAAACSRQRLEQRFQATIGRTVMQEVRRARVARARQLLSTTELSLPLIAGQCGFSSAALLSVAFRRETGIPPGAYRRRFRGVHAREE
jgi:LacI family transcriptional regulator